MKQLTILFLSVCLSACIGKKKAVKKDDFRSVFNGENLDGWHGDSTYWSVKEGRLIGEVTPETILKRNSFIIYQKVQPKDFELKLEYKISETGNSGINYRSKLMDTIPFALSGYQCDIDGKNRYTGQNYEEKKRTTLAYVGEKVSIPPMPRNISKNRLRNNVNKNCWQTRTILDTLGSRLQLKSHIKSNDWNKVHLIVKGNRMQHYVNGVLMSDVLDLDTINRVNKGFLGVQVHIGPPMKVQYKNIRIKY
ncbi:3-keto-disaccharide hydrolase [Flavicella sediminum]|uniref:3-keto-disaccharide hydrolase n=1 Tax=Flavicella sediminum TaxID=2585141 RepID=UPI00111FADEA|nr:DUF1080 domain-containing protein [Flavicella sediminum]